MVKIHSEQPTICRLTQERKLCGIFSNANLYVTARARMEPFVRVKTVRGVERVPFRVQRVADF